MFRFLILFILFLLKLNANEISFTKKESDFLKNHPVIKISNEENWVPFDFRIGDKPTGYSHDLLELIEKKIGVKFEYVLKPSWGEIWKDFTEKKIDVIHPTIEVEKRKKFGNYTQSFFSANCVFVTKQNRPKIKNIEDLFGKVVASPKKWYKTEFLIKNFPQIKVLLTDTMDEAYEAVKQKKAYATVEFASVVNYMLRKNMNRNFKINAEFDELNQRDHGFRHMIRKDWPLLISIFNKAYNSITMEEINNIQKKWFPSDDRNPNVFTKKEKNWLEKNSFVKLAYLSYWDNEHMEKIHIERQYVNLLSKYSNIGIQLVQYYSWIEAYRDALIGKNIQGILFLTKEKKKEKYFDYLPSYFFMPSYLLTHKDNKIEKLRDLEGKSIFIRKGSPFNEFIRKLPYKINIVPLKTEKEIFEKLSDPNSKVEAGISNRVDRDFFEKNHIKVAKKIYNEYSDIHIGINKNQNIVHSILNKAHNSIPKEELTKMKNRLFSKGDIVLKSEERRYLYSKQDINICINPNWMPFSSLIYKDKTDGMISNFIEIISSAIDKKITVKNVKSWQEVMKLMEDGNCDIISFLKKTKAREKYLNFTKPVITTSYVVTTTNEKYFIDDFDSIKNKVFAVVEGAPVYNDVKSIYHNANFIFVKNIEEGFKKVLENKAYGLIDTSASIAYAVDRLDYHNFKIINKLNLDTRLSFGVKKDDEILFNIIGKIVNNISKEEIRKIYNKQIFLQKEKVVDYSLLWKIVLGATIILIIFMYRSIEISKHNKALRNKNRLLKKAQREIEEKNKELERLSTTDKLTGINNRAKIDELLENEIKRSNRYSNNFAFTILDIDYFKMVNDTYGHQVGDEVLKEIARILKNNVREIDFVGRWGGEEFVIILPETNRENALLVCENIRKIVEVYDFSKVGKKTVSLGLSEYIKHDTIETIVKRADDALYEAKKTGRNKVVSKYI